MLAYGAPAMLHSPKAAIPASIVFSGPFTRPTITWSPGPAHGMMLLLLPDAVHSLTGIEPGQWMNQMVAACEVLPTNWLEMCQRVADAASDEERLELIEKFLETEWFAVRSKQVLGLHRYADWSQGLALRAATSKAGRSLRQVERRIRRWAGQPLRELRGFGRAERAFFQAMEAEDEGRPHWSGVAADTGYSDQSHLCRESRRITGCSPAELWHRIAHDEGFWPYRIWQ
ncbi:helix-turn-helix domain-containing protein [Diaphorobacter sp. HDW4B]|uniref:helix-turn-helix domain-containing protein n=1 Tax=Diaphorobacter sp. HDW4B TaxID=2714925 RepID=UPI001F10AA66|nr:helix-turn-helix domain-containing protein [Diaphorobacter sp. HDW4B]